MRLGMRLGRGRRSWDCRIRELVVDEGGNVAMEGGRIRNDAIGLHVYGAAGP